MNDTRLNVLDRREQRLDQAYWMQVELIEELGREGYESEHLIGPAYDRLDRIATLVARASDLAYIERRNEQAYDLYELMLAEQDAAQRAAWDPDIM